MSQNDQNGQIWPKLPNIVKNGKNESKWSKMEQNGPKID